MLLAAILISLFISQLIIPEPGTSVIRVLRALRHVPSADSEEGEEDEADDGEDDDVTLVESTAIQVVLPERRRHMISASVASDFLTSGLTKRFKKAALNEQLGGSIQALICR